MKIKIASYPHTVPAVSPGLYRIHFHHVTGPGIYFSAEIACTLATADEENYIELISSENVLDEPQRPHYSEYIEQACQRALSSFRDYLVEHQWSLQQSVSLELIAFDYHPIDSKPISTEIGMLMFLAKLCKLDHPVIENRKIVFEQC